MISPSQIGFSTYLGCEYHIFTVIEMIKHQVRKKRNTFALFVDFKKAYDCVHLGTAWAIFEKMGIPKRLLDILRSWGEGIRLTLRMDGRSSEAYSQQKGFPQGHVISPICFNLVIEVLLRYLQRRSAEYGVTIDQEGVPLAEIPPLRIVVLAYADDVLILCKSEEGVRTLADDIQDWAENFGFEVGCGNGKSEAMFFDWEVITEANGIGAKKKRTTGSGPSLNTGDGSDIDTSSEEDSPEQDTGVARPRTTAHTRKGAQTGKPAPYVPLDVPPPPTFAPIDLGTSTALKGAIKWVSVYKYLGLWIRSDLLDDTAYKRVEQKFHTATTRLFPYHRLVRDLTVALKLQLFQSLILGCVSGHLPHLNIRTPSDPRVARLNAMMLLTAKHITHAHHTTATGQVISECNIIGSLSIAAMHRLRFLHYMRLHPRAIDDVEQQPYAVRMLRWLERIEPTLDANTHVQLHTWIGHTNQITQKAVQVATTAGWPTPVKAWEASAYAYNVARIHSRLAWRDEMLKKVKIATHSFTERPESNSLRHSVELQFAWRQTGLEAGHIARRAPLSARGPGGSGSLVSLATVMPRFTRLLTKARRGNQTVNGFPFVSWGEQNAHRVARGKSANSKQFAVAYTGKRCLLCKPETGLDSPYEQTKDLPAVVAIKSRAQAMVPKLCTMIESARKFNKASMNNVTEAGHPELIPTCTAAVRGAAATYNWVCMPGTWLTYLLVIGLPYSAAVVRPPARRYTNPAPTAPLMSAKQRAAAKAAPGAELTPTGRLRRRKPPAVVDTNPIELVPPLPEEQFSLPEAFGRLMDVTLLPNNALRRVANSWTRWSTQQLFKLGSVVRPLRTVKEKERYEAELASQLAGVSVHDMSEDDSIGRESDEDGDQWDDDDGMWE
jgi:hypothetical protein